MEQMVFLELLVKKLKVSRIKNYCHARYSTVFKANHALKHLKMTNKIEKNKINLIHLQTTISKCFVA